MAHLLYLYDFGGDRKEFLVLNHSVIIVVSLCHDLEDIHRFETNLLPKQSQHL